MATRQIPVTGAGATPCFFHRRCGNTAAIEKQGKTLCRPCAATIVAEEFPLRPPTREPLYRFTDDLVRQLGMGMQRARRSGRAGEE
jgi:hypothetical protein